MAKLKYRQLDRETRIGRDGERYLVKEDQATFDEQAERTIQGFKRQRQLPKWLEAKLEKYEGKGLNYWDLAAKFQDGFDRRETVRKIKEAKTKEEKIAILEEYHKEAAIVRKRTALKLESMKDVRRIRQEMARRIAQNERS